MKIARYSDRVISFSYNITVAHTIYFGLELILIAVLALIDLAGSGGVIAIHGVVADRCHFNLGTNFDLADGDHQKD